MTGSSFSRQVMMNVNKTSEDVDIWKFFKSIEFIVIMGVLTTVACIAAGLYLLRKCREMQWGHCQSQRRIPGKVNLTF